MSARIAAFARRNALGLVAIFIAVSGTAYAAASLPSNSVGTKQLRKGAVTGSKLAAGAVTGSKLAAGAVTASKVKRGSLTGAQINASTLGLVPNATHATSATHAINANNAVSADTATNANHAVSADQLAGKTPADFAPADRILSSGWKTISDCGNACAVNVTLIDNGTFDIRAGCQGAGGGAFTFLYTNASGTTAPYFEAFSGTTKPAQTLDQFYSEAQGASTLQIHAVNFDLVSSTGTPLSGTVTTIANTPAANSCAFEATAISG